MKLTNKETENEAIKIMCGGSLKAASVIVILQRECPQQVLSLLKVLDQQGVYGSKIADMYTKDCRCNIYMFYNMLVK